MHCELAEEEGYTFIHPFDDPAVATGQGTIAMEIIKELPLVDYILVPIGGGGLATGVSTLAKTAESEHQGDRCGTGRGSLHEGIPSGRRSCDTSKCQYHRRRYGCKDTWRKMCSRISRKISMISSPLRTMI